MGFGISPRSGSPRARLLVHGLEDRTVPAAIQVTTAADSGPGSLRQAILDANATAAADAVTFGPLFNTAQTISLLTALPTVVNPVTITGPGASLLTVRRDPSAGPFRVFTFDSAAPFAATLSGMTITGGQAADTTPTSISARGGGGIRVGGTESLTVQDAVITGNQASGEGGGINVSLGGQLTVRNTTISGNTAGTGPAQYLSGGGIYMVGGTLLVENSTISGNSTPTQGGGVYLYGNPSSRGNWTIRNSTISGNTAGTNGGGVMFYPDAGNNGAASHALTIQGGTVAFNTVTGTAAGTGGGGIAQSGSAGTVTLVSTIVSNNAAATGVDVQTDPTTPMAPTFSIIKNQTGANLTASATNQPAGTDPLLGPLAANGGATKTHALPAGSPAIDHGTNPVPSQAFDQRGAGFARSVGPTDIGAFEFQTANAPTATGTFPDVTGGTSYQFTVTYTATAAGATISGGSGNVHTGNVLVTGPNGYSQTAALNSVSPGGSAATQTATYTITPPGAAWAANDYGTYTISVQANQVSDSQGHFVPAGAVGSFRVLTPATFTVTTAADSGAGSLRDAIAQANARVGSSDTITFGPLFNTPQTITLTGGQLTITDPVTVTGTSAANVTVSGGGTGRVFAVTGPGTLAVTLANLTVTGGRGGVNGPSDGGGILNDGENLTLTNCVVTGNSTGGSGGGVFVGQGGGLTVQNSTLSGNTAAASGGGVYFADGGSLLLDTSTLAGNSAAGTAGGGGLYFFGAAGPAGVTVRNTTISGNSAAGSGGGVQLRSFTGSALFQNTTVSGNTAAGSGGGLLLRSFTATDGVTFQNATVSGNSAAGSGGGVALVNFSGNALFQDATVTANTALAVQNAPSGGGGGGIAKIFGSAAGTITLQGSIVAGNTGSAALGRPDILANGTNTVTAVRSLIGVVDGDSSLAPSSAGNLTGTDAAPLNPQLGPLANNGGPTPTHLPLAGSPAVNNGTAVAGVATDQRGAARPVGVAPDIGAVETADGGPVGTATLTDVTAAGGATYTFTVTYADETSVQAASVGNANVQVTGPNGFSTFATAVNPPTANAPSLTVTYQFAAPGGAWAVGGNGVYTVTRKAGQVSDGTNTTTADRVLGTFQVRVPIVVTNTTDTANPGSLRWAIGVANATPGTADTIVFDSSFNALRTITLGGTQLAVTDSVTITGPGSSLLTITGNNASRVFNLSGPGVLNVTLSGMTITGGNGAAATGQAAGTGGGIALANDNLTLTDTRVTGNTTTAAGGGVGVGYVGSGGAGYFGSLTVRSSTVSGNSAGKAGGGLYFTAGGTLLVDSSTVSGNTAAAEGGGVYFYGQVGTALAAGLTVRNSTISGNSAATNGGGVMLKAVTNGDLLVQNSTVAFNTAGAAGGGIARGDGTVVSTAAVTLQSALVARNAAPTGPDVSSPGTVTGDHSLVGVADSGLTLTGPGPNLTGTVAAPLDPKLGPLANNGGPTLTHALLANSPALNAGANPAGLTTDQRGTGYVRTFGPATDIGAYEYRPVTGAVQVSDGSGQRSVVRSLTVTFSGPVTFAGGNGNALAAFTLTRTGPGAPTGNVTLAATVTTDAQGRTVVTLTFSGPLTESNTATGVNPSLIDGLYTLTINAGLITDTTGAAFDGDGDGTPGGNQTANFHRLYGDFNGDRAVDPADIFPALQNAIFTSAGQPGYTPAFDFDGNGVIDPADLFPYLQQRLFTSI